MTDPTGIPPMCDEARFAAELRSMVTEQEPRLFAVVQEYGVRVDARIVAWGLAFTDSAEVVSIERGVRMSLRTPNHALRAFRFGEHIRARLVWPHSDTSPPNGTT
ncbi:hypothetical protein [Actinoalloteichus caeruleus]|uniref:hypothetical protein n=1 Tax=Actinoalloteichus cyanogriseus TaxID=2893586 RepID=UPI003AAFBE87